MKPASSPRSITRKPTATALPDPWAGLRDLTDARIALGRAGTSYRTETLLNFRLAHAAARDAVHALLDVPRLAADLSAAGITSLEVGTQAADKHAFIANPGLGRSLARESEGPLRRIAEDERRNESGKETFTRPYIFDLVIIVSGGHSALAAQSHAAAVIIPLQQALRAHGWRIAPVIIASLARVKIQDEIAPLLGAEIGLILLGERPGLDSTDSLGAYFTYHPRPECRDADRNCVSNIRPEGIPPVAAAAKLAFLLTQSRTLALSGTALKDSDIQAIDK